MRRLLFLLLLAGAVQAGTLELSQTLTLERQGETLRLRILVENHGPEAALAVQPVVHFLGRAHPLPTLDRLEPGTLYDQRWEAPVPEAGDYGVLVDLRYRSPLAGYSLPAYVQHPAESQPGTVEARLGSGARGPFLLLKHHGAAPVTVTLTVLAPWELGLRPPESPLTLAPGEERLLPLEFTSLDVSHQSTARLHALIDYRQDGRHRIAHSALDLHTGAPLARLPWPLVAGGAGLLLAGLIGLGIWRRRRA